MAKKKIKGIEEETLYFITNSKPLSPGSVELHSESSVLTRTVDDVKKDWNKVVQQVSVIVSDTKTEMSKTGYELDEISISLGFNAKGKLAFIAEAGVEASIEIKFKKK